LSGSRDGTNWHNGAGIMGTVPIINCIFTGAEMSPGDARGFASGDAHVSTARSGFAAGSGRTPRSHSPACQKPLADKLLGLTAPSGVSIIGRKLEGFVYW